MPDKIVVANDISGRANLISTCPPPFALAGTEHRFQTTATMQFKNETGGVVSVDIQLRIMLPDRELARKEQQLDVPAEASAVHTVNWIHDHILHAGEKIVTIHLKVWKREDDKGLILSAWHVCEFMVE
jgi:hypothetical protein